MTEHDKLVHILRGNAAAVEFVETLARVFQVWDDLIDGDKALTATAVNRAFWDALSAIPGNAFFARFRSELQPLIEAAIADWMAANVLEKGDEHGRHLAFGLRDSYHMIVVRCAYLIGGYDWMTQVTALVRREFQDEPLGVYLEGLAPTEDSEQ